SGLPIYKEHEGFWRKHQLITSSLPFRAGRLLFRPSALSVRSRRSLSVIRCGCGRKRLSRAPRLPEGPDA
ncbi:MAG: hypothetical protein OXN89_19425, partial [Bryobacterales bacterium]|nr:hypothetical protein [Bryobacterales bacterium]